MASITSWTRLESQTRDPDMQASLQARIYDPLWLLARQWQLGEFQGQDAGTPTTVRVRTERATVTRYHLGSLPANTTVIGQPYDGRQIPLEALVERERITPGQEVPVDWRFASESGLHFLELLVSQGMGKYRHDYLQRYGMQVPADEVAQTDPASQRFLRVMARRVPDGVRLYADLRMALRPDSDGSGQLPQEPAILEADRASVRAAAEAWLDWYEALVSEPQDGPSAWLPERLEYAFAVAAPATDGEVVLVAPEYTDGHLDWHSFHVQTDVSLDAHLGDAAPDLITRTVIPSPVGYRGMPAARWWEFEDGSVNFGAVEAAPDDLVRLLLTDFVLIYGNDWFVIPVELPVGALYRVRSVVVTDSFGERTLIPHYRSVDGDRNDWRLFTLTITPSPGVDSRRLDELLFLPPVLAANLESPPIETVDLLRDEQANMAWAVERLVTSVSGRPLDRPDAYRQGRSGPDGELQRGAPDEPLHYRLTTGVPDYWIPLQPVPLADDKAAIRLRRARILLDSGGEPAIPGALGRILDPERPLNLLEEELPAGGIEVTRSYQYARWLNGSAFLWVGRRKGPTKPMKTSGLRFDVLQRG